MAHRSLLLFSGLGPGADHPETVQEEDAGGQAVPRTLAACICLSLPTCLWPLVSAAVILVILDLPNCQALLILRNIE